MAEPHIRVLLVDDDEEDFLLTGDLLREAETARFELEWVETFEAGLEALSSAKHDILLVDYYLGAQDGLDFLRDPRRVDHPIPVILLTGQDSQDVNLSAIRAGAADYLVKGQIAAAALERAIVHSLERAREREAARARESQYRAVFEFIEEAVVIFNADGRAIACNPPAERALGATPLDAVRLETQPALQWDARVTNSGVQIAARVNAIVRGTDTSPQAFVAVLQGALDSSN